MFSWNNKYGWKFGSCVIGIGPNDADTGLFEGHPYKSLAKEILQNSLDAKDPDIPDTQPVEVEFRCISITPDEVPGFPELQRIIGLCANYYNKGDDGQKTKRWVDCMEQFSTEGRINILKISDYNTTGATGVDKLKETNWSGLVREKGATNKSEGKGGSHGVGKLAVYSFSAIRTVLYSTKTVLNETAFQGTTILTSFEEDGEIRHNLGVYGCKDNPQCLPVFNMNEIPESFRRDKVGTDVMAIGFEQDEDWKEQISVSVLQYCFYAIYQGKLIVRIVDDDGTIEINKNNLTEMMEEYRVWNEEHRRLDDFQFTAPKYLDILTHPKMKHFTNVFRNKGEAELYLVVDPELDGRSIYEMRSAGMGIQEDLGWRGIGSHFNGLFIATGNNAVDKTPEHNIDSFLRKCEDSAHNEWAPSMYKGHEDEAAALLEDIHKWIRQRVVDQLPKFEGTSHDAFGLNRFIQNIHNAGENTEEEDAFSNYEPLALDTKVGSSTDQKKVPTLVPANAKGRKDKKKEKEEKKKKGGNPRPNNRRGNAQGKVNPVQIGKVWTPFSDGCYHICFTPAQDYTGLQLRILINGDEQTEDIAEISKASRDGNELKTYFGNIIIGDVQKDNPVDVVIELDNHERSGLEVQAYVRQQ